MSTSGLAFKIAMVGSFAVGKTSLVRRFVDSMFDERYHSTIGVKVDRKQLDVDGQPVSLILWDLAGEDRLHQVQVSYLRGAAGYFLVADGTRPHTLEVAAELRERAKEVVGDDIPCRLLLNKHDLADRWISTVEEFTASAEEIAPASLTSALTGQGVEEAFASLAEEMVRRRSG